MERMRQLPDAETDSLERSLETSQGHYTSLALGISYAAVALPTNHRLGHSPSRNVMQDCPIDKERRHSAFHC